MPGQENSADNLYPKETHSYEVLGWISGTADRSMIVGQVVLVMVEERSKNREEEWTLSGTRISGSFEFTGPESGVSETVETSIGERIVVGDQYICTQQKKWK